MIQAITGLIPADALGFCQCHEHILLSKGVSWEINHALCLDNMEKSLLELKDYYDAGGRSLVDAQPLGCNRVADGLLTLSKVSNVNIIASTGFHKLCFYSPDHWLYQLNENEIANLFITELTTGMFVDGDSNLPEKQISACAGIIKSAQNSEDSPTSQKLFSAAAHAQVATGAPIMIHTEKNANPISLYKQLHSWGVPADRMIFCHMDRTCTSLNDMFFLLSEGVYLELDTIGRFKYHSDAVEVSIFKALIEAGFGDRLLFSLDTTRERMKHYTPDGVGLTYILKTFIKVLSAAGISEKVLSKISNENCKKALNIHKY